MTEDIANEAVAETPESPASPPAVDLATFTRQAETLKGKSQALDRTQKELAQAAADRDSALARLAEIEQQNMSELEKAQKARDAAITRAAEAEATAERIRLGSLYPNAVKELEGEALPSEAALARLEKLATVRAEPVEEPMLDKNRAPRTPAAPAGPASIEDLTRLARDAVMAERANRPEYNR